MQMNSYQGKELLSLIRDGDYAHVGEREAIDLVLRPYPRHPGRCILDVGCGRGGTAQYVQQRSWGQVVGIDREPESVARARRVYPGVEFHACDVVEAASVLDRTFHLIYLMNSFYAFADQRRALRVLAQLARESGRLILFDYVDRGGYEGEEVLADGVPLIPHPLRLCTIGGMLAEAGWRLVSYEDLTPRYERWYDALVRRIDARRSELITAAGPDGFRSVQGQYADLLGCIRGGTLGGAIVRAERRG
jgi:SAM-dependent methyltransferase